MSENQPLQSAPIKNILLAMIYELLLICAVSFVGLLCATPFVFIFKNIPLLSSTCDSLCVLAAWYLYLIGTWKKGQTLPMKSWGLVIKTANGNRPTIKHLRLRFLWAVLFFILIPSVAYLATRHLGYPPKIATGLSLIWWILPIGWLFVGGNRQTLYDFLSGTKLFKKVQS